MSINLDGVAAGVVEVNPFIQAVERGDFEAVQANILYGDMAAADLSTAFDKAVTTTHSAVIRLLFDNSTSLIDEDHYGRLLAAIAEDEQAKSLDEGRLGFTLDRITASIANAGKSDKKNHFYALISAVEKLIMRPGCLKNEEYLKRIIQVSFGKIATLTSGRGSREELDRVTNLFRIRVGSEKEVAKVVKSFDEMECKEVVAKLIEEADWGKDAKDKEAIKDQIKIIAKRKGGKRLERRAKKEIKQITDIRTYNAEAQARVAAPHKELRVSKVKSAKQVKKIQSIVKKWKKQAERSFILGQAVAAGVSKEKVDKLGDSIRVIHMVASDIKGVKKKKIRKGEVKYFVAKDAEKRLQAVAVVNPLKRDNAIYLNCLVTNPDNLQITHAGKHPVGGAGTALMQKVAKEAIRSKCTRVVLQTTETAENWYISRFGFRKIDPPYDFRDMEEVDEDQTVLQLDGDALRRAAS